MNTIQVRPTQIECASISVLRSSSPPKSSVRILSEYYALFCYAYGYTKDAAIIAWCALRKRGDHNKHQIETRKHAQIHPAQIFTHGKPGQEHVA